MGGMLAAMMGKMGFIGDRTIFDGPKGFWIMASSDRYRPELMESTPRSAKWAVERVSIKPYTACRHLHPTLDAISDIVNEEGIEAKEVQSVDVKTFFEVVENWNFWPKDSFTIPFSAPLVIALTLSRIPTGLKWFDSKHLSDRRLRDLAARIRFRHWSEADSLYIEVKRELISNVRIKTKDGRLHAKEIRLPKGDPRNPMTDEELRGKFLSLAEPVLKSSRAEEILRTVMNIEELKDCAHLSSCLGK
jgi:2-methylcitrate dehydratase PrpD